MLVLTHLYFFFFFPKENDKRIEISSVYTLPKEKFVLNVSLEILWPYNYL